MKFIVSSKSLLRSLQLISGVISPNNALPILENFLFEINNGKLTLKSTDLDCTMETHIEIESKENYSISVGKNDFGFKAFPEQPLTFLIDSEKI